MSVFRPESAWSSEGLHWHPEPLCSAPMKFFASLAVWFLLAAVLALGIVMAVRQPNPNPWLLILGVGGYLAAFFGIGCRTH
jgi:hypothetical protein